MTKEVRAFARAFIKIYKFKNFCLDSEKYGMLWLTREINKTVELNDNDLWDLDNFIRKEIAKMNYKQALKNIMEEGYQDYAHEKEKLIKCGDFDELCEHYKKCLEILQVMYKFKFLSAKQTCDEKEQLYKIFMGQE